MVQLEATKENGNVIISENSFEHLLSCLDNQKFINDINADATTSDYKKIQQNNQNSIDDFNRQCRDLLHG
jgi:hypothetical protein